MAEKLVGKITHYFAHPEVGIVELSGSLKTGDRIHVKGSTTDFEQAVASMQIEHQNVQEAKKGDTIGLKVEEKVRQGDAVYKME
jgi:putative protease